MRLRFQGKPELNVYFYLNSSRTIILLAKKKKYYGDFYASFP